MSWDIFVQDFPTDVRSISEIPASFSPKALGPRADIIARIVRVLPMADFGDQAWGVIRGDTWSIEVNLGKGDVCRHFALHVRGGDAAAGAVGAILAALQVRGVDSGTGDFFTVGREALDSFAAWRDFRSRVTGDG